MPWANEAVRYRTASSDESDEALAVREVATPLLDDRPVLVVVFVSATFDPDRLAAALGEAFSCPVIGCTTAGQIGPQGFQAGGLTALSLGGPGVRVRLSTIHPLESCQRAAEAIGQSLRAEPCPTGRRRFGLLFVDGLSRMEERLTGALFRTLGDIPVIGGSAGDDLRFGATRVLADGAFMQDAAVLAVVETSRPFQTFRIQHFEPTERLLITTGAEGHRRRVSTINGLPAAVAYAEAVGCEVKDLDAGVFSKHPVMMSVGGDYYIRSIQTVEPDLSMRFYCAIEEGRVLRLGRGVDPVRALERGLAEVHAHVPEPEVIIGCDCILRRLELEQAGRDGEVGALLARHRFVGFSTYGEQYNAIHVNQTLTGIALGG